MRCGCRLAELHDLAPLTRVPELESPDIWHSWHRTNCLKQLVLQGHTPCNAEWFSRQRVTMLRFLSSLLAPAICVLACSGSNSGQSSAGNQAGAASTGGAAGGAIGSGGARSNGGFTSAGRTSSSGGGISAGGSGAGAPGGCRFDSDCGPALGCYMCPASYCMNGKCVSTAFPSYGGASSGSGGIAGRGDRTDAGSGGEDDGGTIPCGDTTCNADELCVYNSCGGTPIVCQPRDTSGSCPSGWQFSVVSCPQLAGGGCSPPPCTTPPPYCAPIPSTCTTVPTETTDCTCANSVCRIGSCRVVVAKRAVHCDLQ
jgi:hypothetical protein